MKGIRSLIFLVAMLLITGFYSLRILWRCRRQTSQDVAALGRGWGQANLRALNRLCRLSYRVEGLERIPSGAVVYLCKHQSAWETMALWAILPIQQKSWILKRELLHIPLFGWALRCFNPIAIDRDHP
ncbi:MAG: lysophospholipid acyltransferase family protein, partial [Pseudomonadota bacterium]